MVLMSEFLMRQCDNAAMRQCFLMNDFFLIKKHCKTKQVHFLKSALLCKVRFLWDKIQISMKM